jgi:hypothetical protein
LRYSARETEERWSEPREAFWCKVPTQGRKKALNGAPALRFGWEFSLRKAKDLR